MRPYSIASIILLAYLLFGCKSTQPVVQKSSPQPGVESIEENPAEISEYRATRTRYFDLVHTILDLKFDWQKKYAYGKAIITLTPHFYSQDSLILNARGMDIRQVYFLPRTSSTSNVLRLPGTEPGLLFTYDTLLLTIHLPRTYSRNDTIRIFIDYTAKPDELPAGGSAAITRDKGLYFINPDGSDPDKPRQFWTQGESQSNSAWFPTIDDPQQKMTQEIYLTVDSNFTTLSNGLLISSINNHDGTKTDYWKQSLPAAPYLTMIAASDFAVVKDQWKNIEVSYYLDKDYEKYARLVFGKTPAMIDFFSQRLGVPYPWGKYSQVVVHDYVSGAMENTTATVHGTNMLMDSSEYLDGNYEDYISHELFHQWFGDLVTTESWSNITLNEGFANYGEYLWLEHSEGRDAADYLNQNDQAIYIASMKMYAIEPILIRFYYDERDDVFDAVSYNKGGRVLHMLRKYVGDDAFFATLKYYLETHRFGTVEIHDLRLAFEKITGEDMNWYFNQWYLKPGHPVIEVTHSWNDSTKTETVTIEQKQNLKKYPLYRLPLAIDVYHDGIKERLKVVVEKQKEELVWNFASRPDLVNVDAERMLLSEWKDDKSKEEYVFQYYHAPLYMDRYEALSKTESSYEANSAAGKMMEDALSDPFWNVRLQALKNIGEQLKANKERMKPMLLTILTGDDRSQVRSLAVKTLNKYFKSDSLVKTAIEGRLQDSSNYVKATAFKIIAENNKEKALAYAQQYESSKSGDLLIAIAVFYKDQGGAQYNDFFLSAISRVKGFDRYSLIETYGRYLRNANIPELEKGVAKLLSLAGSMRSGFGRNAIRNTLEDLQSDIKTRLSATTDKTEEASLNRLRIEIEAKLKELNIEN